MRRAALRKMERPVPTGPNEQDHCIASNKRDDEKKGYNEGLGYRSSSGSDSFEIPSSEDEDCSSPSEGGSEEDWDEISDGDGGEPGEGNEDEDENEGRQEDESGPPPPKRARIVRD